MFGIGGQELILILVVALLVFGPKRLPDLARSLGKGLAEFRRASNDLRRSIEAEPDKPANEPTLASAPEPAPVRNADAPQSGDATAPVPDVPAPDDDVETRAPKPGGARAGPSGD